MANINQPQQFPNPRGVSSGLMGAFLTLMVICVLVMAIPMVEANAQRTALTSPCGPTVAVQPGDTINIIAQRCGVSVAALMDANPLVIDPGSIIAGQILAVPAGNPAIASGPALPNTGGSGTGGGGDLASVTGLSYYNPVAAPNAYVVQEGETLGTIAAKFNTTVDDILISNPHITNPNQVSVGQVLTIPGGGQFDPVQTLPNTGAGAPVAGTGGSLLTLAPERGPAGTQVTVRGRGFPANTEIKIGVGPDDSEYQIVGTVTSKADGSFTAYILIPATAPVGAQWMIIARTADEKGGIAARAISNPFTVTGGDGSYVEPAANAVPAANAEPAVQQPAANVAPTYRFTYTVQRGDTLFNIATQYGASVESIRQANGIADPRRIYPGQILQIP